MALPIAPHSDFCVGYSAYRLYEVQGLRGALSYLNLGVSRWGYLRLSV